MEFIDSHCHPHFDSYDQDRPEVLKRAAQSGVKRLVAVGCSLTDSQKAVKLADSHAGVWVTAGSHPHDGKDFLADKNATKNLKNLLAMPKVVAVGEIGLDYYHAYTSKADQEKMLRMQLEVGTETGLPFVFHVREAFADFWKVFDSYSSASKPLKGVVHSFSAPPDVMDEVFSRGLYIGLNGLITYTPQESWRESAKRAPLDKILLETDAPFLTPVPERGKRCEPRHTAIVAEFLSKLRGEELGMFADITNKNTVELFGLDEERLS